MDQIEFTSVPGPARPRTATVIILLTITAAIFSYLGSYAMANALVAAEVLKPWPANHDPRPRWFLIGFTVLICLFGLIGLAVRHFSVRQLQEIDQMDNCNSGEEL